MNDDEVDATIQELGVWVEANPWLDRQRYHMHGGERNHLTTAPFIKVYVILIL